MDIEREARRLSKLTLGPAAVNLSVRHRSQDFQYRYARTLLLRTFHKLPNKPSFPLEPHAQYALQMSKSSSACDLVLLTEAGVEFKIHPLILIGGPKYLEDHVFPDDVFQQQRVMSVTLPKGCHPILVDRFVNFLYTLDYDDPPYHGLLYTKQGSCNLVNAIYLPKDSEWVPEVTALLDAQRHIFHLHMYALGEQLRYEALMTTAKEKLWGILHGIMRSSIAMGARWILRDCVDACFAPPSSDARICADENGMIKETIVAAVLSHEVNSWNKAQRDGLRTYLPEPQYKEFWTVYHGVAAENAELLAPVPEMRPGDRRAQTQAKRQAQAGAAEQRRERKQRLRRSFAGLMDGNPAQLRDNATLRRRYRAVEDTLLPPPTTTLMHRNDVGDIQHDNRDEDEGFYESTDDHTSSSSHGAEAEMQHGMEVMRIDDNA